MTDITQPQNNPAANPGVPTKKFGGVKFPKEGTLQKTWHIAVAAVYLTICLFDFIVMPIVVSAKTQITQQQVFSQIANLPPATQVAIVDKIDFNQQWHPLTLEGGAFFHIAFGFLLTGVAVTRGMAQNNLAKRATGMEGEDDNPQQ